MKQDNRDNSRNWQTTNTGGTNYVGEIHFHGSEPNSRAKPNPKAVLLKAIKMQVETRLESSLHNQVYIIPSQDKNPNQVEHPWSIDVKSGSKPKVRLPQNTHIITVFDQPGINGRLLILGKPGDGKTTMLLKLAQKLVERAENDLNEPIPILLSLSSWQNEQQSIKDWIITELNSGKYYKVRKDITKQWIEDGEIIPLLDGLDELASPHQEQCVKKLNDFLQPGNWIYPLVVCSRIEEYQLYSTQLVLNTSLELQPFSDEQIQEYLRRTGNEQLGDSIRDDRELRELAQTPFLLNVIVLSYQKLSLDKWQKFESSADRLHYLFAAYVEVMLERKYEGKCPSDEKTKNWLGWLAGKLIEQNETDFFIEKMQPSWLEDRRYEQIYRLIIGLFFGLFFELIGGLSLGLFFGLMGGLSAGRIRTPEIIQFDWEIFWRKGLIEGVIFGLLGGMIGGEMGGEMGGLGGGMIGGLIFGLMGGLKSSEIETRTSPNQGIWESLKNTIIVGLSVGLIAGLIAGQIGGQIGELIGGQTGGLSRGLIGGLILGLTNGGQACIQHFVLRLTLYRNGHIPWNYARFLDYATDRLFLQRVGGGYRFMHDLLRQHFATHYR